MTGQVVGPWRRLKRTTVYENAWRLLVPRLSLANCLEMIDEGTIETR